MYCMHPASCWSPLAWQADACGPLFCGKRSASTGIITHHLCGRAAAGGSSQPAALSVVWADAIASCGAVSTYTLPHTAWFVGRGPMHTPSAASHCSLAPAAPTVGSAFRHCLLLFHFGVGIAIITSQGAAFLAVLWATGGLRPSTVRGAGWLAVRPPLRTPGHCMGCRPWGGGPTASL